MRYLIVALALTMSACAANIGGNGLQEWQQGTAAYKAGNTQKAAEKHVEAALKGHANAQYNLGIIYDKGWGVPQDYKAAANWYRKAAKQGFVEAQYNLGIMYKDGQGVPQNYREAAKWAILATEQGSADGQKLLSIVLSNISEQERKQVVYEASLIAITYKDFE